MGNSNGDATRLTVVSAGWLFSRISPEEIVSYLTMFYILYQAVMYSPRVYKSVMFWVRKLRSKRQRGGDVTGDSNDNSID